MVPPLCPPTKLYINYCGEGEMLQQKKQTQSIFDSFSDERPVNFLQKLSQCDRWKNAES